MIESSFNYIRNPIWISNELPSDRANRFEGVALTLLEPARYMIRELCTSQIREWSTKDVGEGSDSSKVELYLIAGQGALNEHKFSSQRLHEKIYRVARLVFVAIAAALMTPLGLMFHQVAFATSKDVRRRYEEIKSWKNYPGLLLTKTGAFSELRELIKKTSPNEYNVFFKSTPGGSSVLKTLLFNAAQSSLIEQESANTLALLIDNWAGENFHEYLSSPSILEWIIQRSNETLFHKLLSKYKGKLETFFGQAIEGNTLLDIAATDYYSRWGYPKIALLMIEECPVGNLMLLLGPNTNLLSWPSQVLIALLKKCPESQIGDCLKFIKSRNGTFITEIISSKKSDVLQTLFEKFPRERLRDLLLPTTEGETLWDLVVKTSDLSLASDRLAASILERCPSDSLNLLISPASNPLEWRFNFKNLFTQKIEGMIFDNEIEEVRTFLTEVQSDGDTVLHREKQRAFFKTFAETINIDISKVFNREGLSPCDLDSYTLSLDWLKKPKYSSQDVKQVSVEEYKQRANTLRSEVFRLWDSLVFGRGEGELSSTLLIIGDAEKKTSDIRLKLDRMLGKILNKEAWLGTPPAADTQGLHLFYSEMLLNFEGIITFLKNLKDPQQTAGYLIDIAKVEFQERCAAAYQAEIDQKAVLCAPDEAQSAVEQLFERAAAKALRSLIDQIMRKKNQGAADVHYSRRVSYACGLARAPDPLDSGWVGFQERLAECRRDLLEGFKLSGFIEDVSRNVENEMAIDLTKTLVPGVKGYSLLERVRHKVGKTFYGDKYCKITTEELYRKIILKAKGRENTLKQEILTMLHPLVRQPVFGSWFFSQENENLVFSAIQQLKGTPLPSLIQGGDLIEKIVSEATKKFQDITSCPDLNLRSFFNSDCSNHDEVKESLIVFLKSKNKYAPLSRLKIQSQFSQMISTIDGARTFLNAVVPYLSDDQSLTSIVEIQKNYHSSLSKMIQEVTPEDENEDLDLSFDQNSFLWPSQAFENSYKNWKSKDDLLYKGRMVLKLITVMGILTQKKQLTKASF